MTDTPTDRAALEALADEAADRADTEAIPGGFDARVAATLRALAARVIELEAEVERLREAAEVLEQVSAAQTRLVYEGIDRGKGHWPAWDDVARAVTAARALAAKLKGEG